MEKKSKNERGTQREDNREYGINAIEKRRAKEHNQVEVVKADQPEKFKRKSFGGKQIQGPG